MKHYEKPWAALASFEARADLAADAQPTAEGDTGDTSGSGGPVPYPDDTNTSPGIG